MPYNTDAGSRSWASSTTSGDAGDLDRLDRILLAVCAVIWLLALGAAVAAIVALVHLGRGQAAGTASSDTPWLLYVVIGVSAAVIAGAVPLLLRARRDAVAESPPQRQAQPGAQKLRVFGSVGEQLNANIGSPWSSRPTGHVALLAAAVDQVWLRCAALIGCLMGGATLLIAVATYLMAADHAAVAWVLYGLAGAATLAMVAVPWFYLRQLFTILGSALA